MVQTFDLSNKIILISGGYGHLGEAIVDSLAYHRASVYVLGRKETEFNKKFGDKDNIKFVPCDIAQAASIKASFKKVMELEGKIDVMVNNAFYSKGQSPEEMTDEEFMYGIEGSLASTFKCIRELIPYYKQQMSGKIINVSSMYGLVAPDFEIYEDSPEYLNPPHYGAAKAGVIQLTKYYASYLGKYQVQVNAVSPGPFPSEEVQKDKPFIKKMTNKTLLGRIGKPVDLAGAFVFLSSDAANYITGQNIVVDGGWTIR